MNITTCRIVLSVSLMHRTVNCIATSSGEDVFASLKQANTTDFTLRFTDSGVEVEGEGLVQYSYVDDTGCNNTNVGFIVLIVVVCVVIILLAVVIIVLLKRSEAKGRPAKLG